MKYCKCCESEMVLFDKNNNAYQCVKCGTICSFSKIVSEYDVWFCTKSGLLTESLNEFKKSLKDVLIKIPFINTFLK